MHDASMVDVPWRIQDAERWRIAGRRLREKSPEAFAKIFTVLAGLALLDADDEECSITERYKDS